MNASKLTPILLTILFACFALSANCERGDEGRPEAGGHHRWQPNGDKTTTGMRSSSSTMDVVAPSAKCEPSVCEGSPCFCCPNMPTKPCFLLLDACLRVCTARRQPAAPLPQEVPSSVDLRTGRDQANSSDGE